MHRAVFRGGAGGATAHPDVFDLLQNSETNLMLSQIYMYLDMQAIIFMKERLTS